VRTVDYRLSGQLKIHIDRDWLRYAYVDRGMSCAEIDPEVGTSAKTVHRRLYELGIPVRAPGVVGSRDPQIHPEDVLTKKFLSDAIRRKRMSLSEIGSQTGITQATVGR
jgi:hypothetical protein